MEKQCVNYVGLACVDGTCPEIRNPEVFNCKNCYRYQGCADCALAGTEYCEKEEFYCGDEE